MGRIGPIRLILLPPFLDPCRRQSLAVAAIPDELPLQTGDLPVQQVVGLVDQADEGVGDYSRVGVVDPGGVGGVIRRIGRIPTDPSDAASPPPEPPGLWVILLPLPHTALAQKILVVEQELIQAGPGDIDQPQFGLGRGRRGAAAFSDILPPAARRLHHLVHRA